MPVPRAVAAAFHLAVAATAAHAQEVRGHALATATGAAVPGVIVTLVGGSGMVEARTLTSDSGTFRLRAPRADVYRLRVLRIGFQPTVSPPFSLAVGQLLERNLDLTGQPVALASVQVAAERTCAVRPDSGSSAFVAWEEARKALDASLLTRDRGYTMEIVRFERAVSASNGALLSEQEVETRAAATRPFVSVPLGELDSAGYVHRDGEGTIFRAPDEEVLLSDQFAATHCFRVAEPAAMDEMALAFEPVGGRALSDIRGTLVLDRATAALRRLDFTFVNVGPDVERAQAGGRVEFRQLPAGGWIVDRWAMRFPMLERVSSQQVDDLSDIQRGLGRRRETVRLRAMQEAGGEVVEVARGDSVMWQVERPRLSGTVRDEGGAPIVGATVTIPTLGRRAVTGDDGQFAMPAVRRGRRLVLVATPLLDSLGLTPVAREADTRSASDVTLVLPGRQASFDTACAPPADDGSRRDAAGFVRGTTRGPHRERIGGVRIVVRWFQGTGTLLDPRNPGSIRTLETTSSAAGEYSFCGVPVDQLLTLRLWIGPEPAGAASARVPAGPRLLLLDLPVATGTSGVTPPPATPSPEK